MRTNLRRAALALAVAALLGACGGQPFSEAVGDRGATAGGHGLGKARGAARLLASLDRTTAAKSARMSMHIGVTGLGQAMTAEASGVVDFVTSNASMTMSTEFGGQDISIEMRIVDGVVYMKMNGQWTRQADLGMNAATATPTDPSEFLDYLRGVADDVREVGEGRSHGARTTEYSGTLNLRRALQREGVPAEVQDSVREALQLIGDIDMPFTVGIDDEGRLRRIDLVMDLSMLGAALGGPAGPVQATATIELYDFGVAVDVEAPI
jgi:hypothetical protein